MVGEFMNKCSFCGQEKETLIKNSDALSVSICPECIIACTKILIDEKNNPNYMELSELIADLNGVIDERNRLRIISWNCHYGLNLKKYLVMKEYNPQVLIIQECTKADFEFIKNMWEYRNWYNDDMYSYDRGLGLAIFSNNCKINFTEFFNRKFRYMIPYEITWNDEKFVLFMIWINPVEKNNYIRHFYDAVDYYKTKGMLNEKSILIGDFNLFSNDKNNGKEKMEEKLYPLVNCTKGTQFSDTVTYFDSKYGYGINDLCFITNDIKNDYKIDINIPNEWDEKKDKEHHWKDLSDHSPIILDIKLKYTNSTANCT
jgi:hypothetical protein